MIRQFKNSIRKNMPELLLSLFREIKKNRQRKILERKKINREFITEELLVKDLVAIGLREGDTVLVHSSMSRIGYLEEGPKTVINALLQVTGKNGTLLFPSSPAPGLTKDYLEQNSCFDILNTPSAMGAITEYFRKMEGVKRSFHPTEPVCALGPRAEYFIKDHYGQLTPYNSFSPFYKVSEQGGKIVMLGVTLDNAGTSLHTLEDAVDFKFPVYDEKIYEVNMIDEKGHSSVVKTKVHNPVFSAKRKCDELIPLFEKEGVLKKGRVGEAPTLFIDAKGMFEVMVKYYHEKEVTMYTPEGAS